MKLYLYGAAVLLLLALLGGVYLTGRSDGKEIVRKEHAANLAKAVAETARVNAERAKLAQRIESDLQPKLAAADANARDLARRLRLYSRRSPLPESPGTPSGPTSAPGEPNDLGTAEEDHFAACARDSERLAGWQQFYSGLRADP